MYIDALFKAFNIVFNTNISYLRSDHYKKKLKFIIYIVLISVLQNLSNPLSNYTELDRWTKISKIRIKTQFKTFSEKS